LVQAGVAGGEAGVGGDVYLPAVDHHLEALLNGAGGGGGAQAGTENGEVELAELA
jgi:hypothetical protein